MEKTLRDLGFSKYESLMLSCLVKLGRPMKAQEISEITGIPRTKVYQVGKSLEQRGLIKCVGYRPTLFIGPPRDKLMGLLLRHIVDEFNEKLKLLGSIQEFELPVYLIGGNKVVPVMGKMVTYLMDNLASRKDEAIIIVDEDFVEVLIRRYREGVRWYIMSRSKSAASKLKSLRVRVMLGNSPFTGILSEEEGLLIYSKGRGIYTTDKDLLRSLRATFYIIMSRSI